jgi:hypothetical protein
LAELAAKASIVEYSLSAILAELAELAELELLSELVAC